MQEEKAPNPPAPASDDAPAKPKEQPNYKPSGKLATEKCMYHGIQLRWDEPPDMHEPTQRWRCYVFKNEKNEEIIYLHRHPGFMFGRDRRIADIPLDHPSCSAQHAVLYYREIKEEREDGRVRKVVKPFLMDLGSTNGTQISGEKMEDHRYYEIREGDVVKFGFSTREYVFMVEGGKLADDVAAAREPAEPVIEVNPALLAPGDDDEAAPTSTAPAVASPPAEAPSAGTKHAREAEAEAAEGRQTMPRRESPTKEPAEGEPVPEHPPRTDD
ncbi:putative Smad nuclear-interacting protein 1 [Paratrimastix pyriformis]|uniref:Smad nuclear-interacting protein 1 n=1 Tax=Paratrimastix pyriformis TaxID=342808 RepID=A0ABQ8UNQ1_9EUKA|nr:putative Smad nuclear-interacting protein 1 [Paratrimastix pyriformis]